MERASNDRPRTSIGLSWLVWKIAPMVGEELWGWGSPMPRRFTSSGPKKLRGHVHAALSRLAKEGIMFGRNKPEGGVQSYEHGERDKYFHVRISQADAKKRLARMN